MAGRYTYIYDPGSAAQGTQEVAASFLGHQQQAIAILGRHYLEAYATVLRGYLAVIEQQIHQLDQQPQERDRIVVE